jgi:Fic family protein
MSRLLTLLLLYEGGYGVGRYVSLERLIAETKGSYYDALGASTESWHQGAHDIYPWLSYFLGVVIAACKEFEERVGAVQGVRGSKRAAVLQFIRSSLADEFTFDEIRMACPSVSDSHIRKVLDELKRIGAVRALSTGRSARWKRLSTDF